MKIGIACASGSLKGVFVHGVLAAFENFDFMGDFYAASSSAAIPTAFAAIHKLSILKGTEYWRQATERTAEANIDISSAIKAGIKAVFPLLKEDLFANEASRFAVAASAVLSAEAAALTQGEGARRLGQKLVLSIRKKDNSWAKSNLACRLFDTMAAEHEHGLTPANLADALYATTRMLHAWKDAAWINGEPYVDASYTCMCPAVELVQMGMEVVISISPECGTLYRDFFQSEILPSEFDNTKIHFLQPERNLAEIGVDYLKVTEEGLAVAYEMGKKQGSKFIESFKKSGSV